MKAIHASATEKKERYEELLPQLKALLADEQDTIANLGNTAAVLKYAFPQFSWVGWYILKNSVLVLGPFQGRVACTRIALDRGVCGAAAQHRETVIVPDVHAFPGHIACDNTSRSEIVIPLLRGDELLGVLDVDSDSFNAFDEVDKFFLENIAAQIASVYSHNTLV